MDIVVATLNITSIDNLTVGTITQQYSDTIPAGVVISQNPVGGTMVSTGSTIDLVVSLGPPVTVPDVTGIIQGQANSIIFAHNLVIDHFRKEKQINTCNNEDYEADLFNSSKFSAKNIEQLIVHDQIIKDVRKLIDELPDDQREVVVLRHYGQLSFKEIAEQTDVSINTALGRMRYALINMRKMIEEKKLSLTYY